MNVILFDREYRDNFLPLTFTKPVGQLRMGVLTFAERWEKLLQAKVSFLTEAYLSEKFFPDFNDENTFINPCFFPNHDLVEQIKGLEVGQNLVFEGQIVACKTGESTPQQNDDMEIVAVSGKPLTIFHAWDLFTHNDAAIRFDFDLLTKGRQSQPISPTNQVLFPENIFLEAGAKVEFAILNASAGPIYIGKDAEIMEGSMIRGSLALCDHGKINMGSKIYPDCTIGPYCKVGGELNNAILQAYSNKGHDGFLGNSVIGEWCNLGADTNTSNLKNNYAQVKLWHYKEQRFIPTGLQFCGLIMGDFAKSAINTQFNTGTVVGVSANIFQAGFPPNKVEHFSWGGNKDAEKFTFDRACEAAEKMMERRNIELTKADIGILESIYNL